ncbi:hypothetical protein QTP86_012696 [Hemibagrus guttatus]|nr:hypothetical protein QTP86_012696 [Hemibagrus guttatus]
MDRTEENRQEYKELQRRVKREVSKAKQKAYDELYTRLDTREGEKDLYRLASQRDRDGKDVQQVRVIKDRDGRVLTSEESVQRRWKEYFEELMNEENEREKRVEGVNSVEQKVDKIRKDEVRKALKRMKSGKAVGPDDIPVEVWKCLGEAAVEFLTSLFNRVLESEDSFKLHSVDLELEAMEKQIRDLQVKQAQLRQRKAALESSRTDAHLSQVNSRRETITPTTSTPCASLPRPSARTRPAQVSFTPAPGYHAAWMQQQRKTRVKPRARTSPPPPPPVFEIPTQNRFAPLHETACDAVIIGDSIVRHVRATAAKGKVHTRCLPGARVLDVSAQVPAILKKNIGAVVLHAGTNDIRLKQTEILKKDFRSLVELVRTTSPTTRIIVSGPLPTFQRGIERVPRKELWYCMRKSGVAEKYVRVVQDMYERSRTVVRCAVGQTEEFNVEVELHQGSALSPFLFAIVMDQLSEEVRQESPRTMMFADDIVICSESREQVEENLERWRFALERRGMKVSRSKTEYMCVNEREGSGTVRLQGEEVKKVQEFKYLGSTVQSNGECGKEVKKRVQAGWNGWRKVLGVLCDQKISARIKGKVYRTVVRPAMLYGLETVSLRKRQESELEVAELKMLRFSLGVTRLDRIRNEYIRGTAHVGRLGDKDREARLRWFGHVQRRESAAPDAPNPSPSQKVRSSDGSWGGARNVERPVGGARSRARHLGGEREAKARRVGGSEDQGEASGGNEDQGEASGGNEDQGEASGGSEKQERDKWGEQRT